MTSEARLAENLRGAGFMVASMAGFSCNDAFIKSVAGDVPLFQAVFLRGLIATALLGGLAWWQGAHRFRPGRRDRRRIGLRCVAEIGGTVCFLTALFNMPIANASAILQSVPLAVTLAAALVFGEPVGWRRYLAIAIGFAGVIIIVRPGSDGFTGYAVWALAAVVFIVARDLVTRRLTPDVPGTTVAFVTSLALTVAAGLAAVATDWAPVGPGHVLVLTVAALCLIVGYIFGVRTMRVGEIGFVQPFRYTLLVWAMLLGIVMFREWPDGWMLAGSAIVVGTGLFALHRERRLGLAQRRALDEATGGP
jgi:drug/metabolite transporter (DMT)-like permease